MVFALVFIGPLQVRGYREMQMSTFGRFGAFREEARDQYLFAVALHDRLQGVSASRTRCSMTPAEYRNYHLARSSTFELSA